ncbi:hypothetical protein H8B15_18750 [Hymenobacter sp. BT507]|uniref:DUF6311 domain-containing protein n=1 Tax=Hymenobacter citatus TaxID=2763506 RepID=A0ABR7MPH0_9BACT|nr:hypothetical protein [Hymenobacter citatus]MBC6612968.1 hypothetical protein [Hymenobacter citatus]
MWHPTEYLLSPAGDGIKSYFALLYYVQIDHGQQFTGMLYPYGELLTYTDGFPLLAWALKTWESVFGLSKASVVGALNLTILLSSLPATALLYAIMRRYRVGQLLAACAALLIVFLSPQWFRITGGHLTLALFFAVPLLWYLQLRLMHATTTRQRARWLAGYLLSALLLALAHPYYLLHALLLPLATAAVQLVQQLGRRAQPWRMPLWLVLSGTLPVLLFRLWIGLIDSMADRPVNPYGFFVYHTNIASVFGPVIEPFAAVFAFIFHTNAPIWEGYAYIGLPAVLGIGLLVVRGIDHLVRKRWLWILAPTLPNSLGTSLWAATLVLLFAAGWPFILPSFSGLIDWLPGLKQFRSLGRFAWIFYYVIGVVTVVQLWQLYRMLQQRRVGRLGVVLLSLLLLLWGLEAKYQVEAATHPLRDAQVATHFLSPDDNYAELLSKAGHDPARFQALLPLPYYSLGSEKFDLGGSEISVVEGFRAALNLRLPIIAGMMSRTSTTQALSLLQLFSSDLTPKSLPAQLPSQRPLLVVASRQDALRPAETALLQRGAQQLLQTDRVTLYELPLTAFATARPAKERAWFAAHQASLLKEGPIWRTAPGPAVIWRTFSENSASASFTQPGAAHRSKGLLTLYEGPLPGATDTTSYELSIWAYAKTSDWLPVLRYRQLDPSGNEVERREESMKTSTEIHGDWVRFAYVIQLKSPQNRVEVAMDGADILVDDLLIRPRSTQVYWLDSRGQPVLNGYPLAW